MFIPKTFKAVSILNSMSPSYGVPVNMSTVTDSFVACQTKLYGPQSSIALHMASSESYTQAEDSIIIS